MEVRGSIGWVVGSVQIPQVSSPMLQKHVSLTRVLGLVLELWLVCVGLGALNWSVG